MIYLHWTILVIYAAIVIATMVAILLDHRQPAKTMAWILVLTFLPLAGIILYYFFGQNVRRERFISQHSLDQLTKRSMLEFVEQRDLQLPEQYRRLIDLFSNQSMALPFKSNEVEYYCNGYEFFPALLEEIGKAEHHIHIVTFIIDDDPLGRLISDALIDKARQGVEVRLVYDDVACWKVKNSFFERMRDEGIEVHAFMPVKFPAFTSKANYRNHRKICVIDGRVGFIGGMNIAMRYVKGIPGQPWRDTHIKMTGSGVYGLQRAFLVDWYFADRTLITNRSYYPPIQIKPNNCLAQVVTSNPTSRWPDMEQGYVHILTNAREYVYMETPYFLPTEPILFAMRTAAIAGVDVRLMVPRHGDSHFVSWASRSYLKGIAKDGVKVLLYNPAFNHSKLLVADDMLSTCGSTNVDFRSFEDDFEANAFFYDHDVAMKMKQIYLNDEAECTPLEDIRDISHQSFIERLWESIVRLLSPLM